MSNVKVSGVAVDFLPSVLGFVVKLMERRTDTMVPIFSMQLVKRLGYATQDLPNPSIASDFA